MQTGKSIETFSPNRGTGGHVNTSHPKVYLWCSLICHRYNCSIQHKQFSYHGCPTKAIILACGPPGSWKSPSRTSLGLKVEQRPSQSNFSTVAVVPVSEDVPLSQFTLELHHSLLAVGKNPYVKEC